MTAEITTLPNGVRVQRATGIDYGRGVTNIDAATHIRYGVISQHTVGQAWYDNAEDVYDDEAHCPVCGESMAAEVGGGWVCSEHGARDDDDFCDAEPLGQHYEAEGYVLANCLDSDIMVVKAPYYTYAPHCSPCVPGAGNLDEAERVAPKITHAANGTQTVEWRGGTQTYCLGHDWFERHVAPYPVFSVETGREVMPEELSDGEADDYTNANLVMAEDGYADGGEPYTDEELADFNAGK
jgi:hypothetical protein